MRKRTVVLSILTLLIGGALFYIFFIRQTFQKQISVPYPMLKTALQFSDPANLVKWYMPFAQTREQLSIDPGNKNLVHSGNYSLEIQNQSMVSTLLKNGAGKKKKEFLISTVPDTTRFNESVVTIAYKNTLFNQWFSKGELVNNALQSLGHLKDYMEDTKRMYGYPIQFTSVADTAFLFISETVPVTEKRASTKKLFERLLAYADKKNAAYNGVRIFYSQKSGDEIILFASIGVTNKIAIDPGDPFQYKMMPLGKNLLEATYQGPYGESEKVFRALESFKTDHGLVSMAIPFQKFLSDGYDFADDQIVQLKVYYPIF